MTGEKSAIENWLDEEATKASLTFDLSSYSISLTNSGLRLELRGTWHYPFRRRLRGDFLIESAAAQSPTSLSLLPTTFYIQEAVNDPPKDQPIGYVQYFDSMKTDDGVVDEPAQIESVIVVAPSVAAQMISLLTTVRRPWQASLSICGIDRSECGDRVWKTDGGNKLLVTEFGLVLKAVPISEQAEDSVGATDVLGAKLSATLEEIRASLKSGVRLRWFS